MAERQNYPKTNHVRSSVIWGIVVVVFHFAATFIIAVIYMQTGSSFTTREVDEFHPGYVFWKTIMCLWTPLAMAARSPDHTPNENALLELVILWSCLVGSVSGFAILSGRRGVPKAIEPNAN
jgi:hypothetical protein